MADGAITFLLKLNSLSKISLLLWPMMPDLFSLNLTLKQNEPIAMADGAISFLLKLNS